MYSGANRKIIQKMCQNSVKKSFKNDLACDFTSCRVESMQKANNKDKMPKMCISS